MTHSAITLAVDALATFRVTRLLVDDSILQPARVWVSEKSSWWMELVTCPWCTSVWVAAAMVALQIAIPTLLFPVACVAAFSAIAGLCSVWVTSR